MKSFYLRPFLLAAIALLSSCTYQVRESNVVFPRKGPSANIVTLREQLPNYRINDAQITTPDGERLYSIRFIRSDAVATVLYFGGNGYTLAKSAPDTVKKYMDAPVNVVLVDHRGYGQSTGTPTMDKLMSDADVVYEHIRNDSELGEIPLIVHGHSLGSFMAGHVAGSHRLAGVILESSVTTTEEWTAHLRSKQSAWIRILVRRVIPDGGLAGKGNSGVASALDEPTLFVVGANDDVAPARFSQALFDAAPLPAGDKRLLIVPGKGHMNASESPEFHAALSDFVTHVADEAKAKASAGSAG